MVIDDFPGLFRASSSVTCKIIFSRTMVMGKLSIFYGHEAEWKLSDASSDS